MPRFAILIPARNEEKLLPGCLESIKAAAAPLPDQVEVIVAVNRCTDHTEEIAVAHGAKVVHEGNDSRPSPRRTLSRHAVSSTRSATGT